MRSKLCIITIVACAALTGCSNVPDLSHVDNDLTAQYMADALLKNDDSYQGVLDYDHSILEATPSPTAEPTPAVTVAPTQEQDTDSANAGSDGASTDTRHRCLTGCRLTVESDCTMHRGRRILVGTGTWNMGHADVSTCSMMLQRRCSTM